MKNTKRLRFVYALLFAAVLLVEIIIGVFIRDDFVRPFVGDVLVVVLICFLARILLPQKPYLLSLYCTLFACFVEIMQYFDIVSLLGLDKSSLLGIMIGSTFDPHDLLCYAVGGAVAFCADTLVKRTNR